MNYEVEMFYDYVFDYYSKGCIFELGLNLWKRYVIKYCNMYLADQHQIQEFNMSAMIERWFVVLLVKTLDFLYLS